MIFERAYRFKADVAAWILNHSVSIVYGSGYSS